MDMSPLAHGVVGAERETNQWWGTQQTESPNTREITRGPARSKVLEVRPCLLSPSCRE